jgi:hypothetical protein
MYTNTGRVRILPPPPISPRLIPINIEAENPKTSVEFIVDRVIEIITVQKYPSEKTWSVINVTHDKFYHHFLNLFSSKHKQWVDSANPLFVF